MCVRSYALLCVGQGGRPGQYGKAARGSKKSVGWVKSLRSGNVGREGSGGCLLYRPGLRVMVTGDNSVTDVFAMVESADSSTSLVSLGGSCW